jgi:hypothetical protein
VVLSVAGLVVQLNTLPAVAGCVGVGGQLELNTRQVRTAASTVVDLGMEY